MMSPLRRKILVGFGLAFIASIVLFVGYDCVVVPLKFRYLVHRVESARTDDEELRAFKLAADWGRVWEVDRLSPKDVTATGRQITGNWVLRLEWLESSPFDGGAYVAYRAVIATNNLNVLFRRY
jgi:hypothetical protein